MLSLGKEAEQGKIVLPKEEKDFVKCMISYFYKLDYTAPEPQKKIMKPQQLNVLTLSNDHFTNPKRAMLGEKEQHEIVEAAGTREARHIMVKNLLADALASKVSKRAFLYDDHANAFFRREKFPKQATRQSSTI